MPRQRGYRRRSPRKSYGKKFRTRAGKVGRYVYKGGRRVAFEVAREAKKGSYRYVRNRTYRSLKRRYG